MQPEDGSRPPVSVIVPFLGSGAEADALLDAMSLLRFRPGDELIVVDNGAAGAVATAIASLAPSASAAVTGALRAVSAPLMRSSYYARNVGAGAAANTWLLFVDADCRPSPSLLEDYFRPPPGEDCGVLAGEVDADPDQDTLPARHARARGHLAVADHLAERPHPAGVTANLLVRRDAWEDLGGFHEVRSGADLEFCWRAVERGWELAHRPAARVMHLHAESLRAMLRKSRRYGPGQLWAHRRFPAFRSPPDVLHHLWRTALGVPAWLLTGQFERGAFKALDLAWHVAYAWGYWMDDNRAEPAEPGRGARGTAVAVRRPSVGPRRPGECMEVEYLEDGSPRERVSALIWLAARHPLRTAIASVRGGRDGPPLRELAPAARRLRAAREVRVLGDDQAANAAARRLAAMLGRPTACSPR